MKVNVWNVSDPIQEIIRKRVPVDAARLRDPDVPLEGIARARTAPDQGRVKAFFAQGATFARRFVGDRIVNGDPMPASQLAPGEGRVLQADGEKTAVYRDDAGELHGVSPVCTHMGCLVEFNRGERTWDCPCHGSRFDAGGHVLHGPAKRNLKVRVVDLQTTPQGQ